MGGPYREGGPARHIGGARPGLSEAASITVVGQKVHSLRHMLHQMLMQRLSHLSVHARDCGQLLH
jgi:hypothetical protein